MKTALGRLVDGLAAKHAHRRDQLVDGLMLLVKAGQEIDDLGRRRGTLHDRHDRVRHLRIGQIPALAEPGQRRLHDRSISAA